MYNVVSVFFPQCFCKMFNSDCAAMISLFVSLYLFSGEIQVFKFKLWKILSATFLKERSIAQEWQFLKKNKQCGNCWSSHSLFLDCDICPTYRLMIFGVGTYNASVMESASHVCLGVLSSDWPLALNYQTDCLSSLFARILISPNSVLTPSGECVGRCEEEVSGMCMCVRHTIVDVSPYVFDAHCQTWVPPVCLWDNNVV